MKIIFVRIGTYNAFESSLSTSNILLFEIIKKSGKNG